MTARPDSRPLRIATRGSALARAQATLVRDALMRGGYDSQLVIVETEGDRRAPDTAWGEGAFVAAIEGALLDERADVAVHSAKDMPLEADGRLMVGAYLAREDPRDALVVRAGLAAGSLATLPSGAVIGTDSPRRSAFVRRLRPDLEVRPLHGNVDTRLRRLDGGDADALVLAMAGLLRLGRTERITEVLDPRQVPPAPGQGAIAVQVRSADHRTRAAVGTLDHPPTRLAVEVERAFLDACGGGCRAPIGAVVTDLQAASRLVAGVADGRGGIRIGTGTPTLLGARALAADLVLGLAPAGAPLVLVTRPVDRAIPLVRELAVRGLAAAIVPGIAVEPVVPDPVPAVMARLPAGAWVVVTSRNGAQAIGDPRRDLRWAAVGDATASVLLERGVVAPWIPQRADATTLGAELPVGPGDSVLLVRGDRADGTLPRVLGARGARVQEVVAYRTLEGPSGSGALLRAALTRRPIALTFASGSAVRGILALAASDRAEVLGLPAVCIGASTAAVARAAGLSVVRVAERPDDAHVAALAADLVEVPA